MTLDFEKDEIKTKELLNGIPYVGYFSPMGKLIDYNTDFGGQTHASWTNPISLAYIKYVSYIVADETIDGSYAKSLKEKNPQRFKEMTSFGINELVYRGYSSYLSGVHNSMDEFIEDLKRDIEEYEEIVKKDARTDYDLFKLNLLKFFEKAYRNRDYLNTTHVITKLDNFSTIEKKVKDELMLSDIKISCDRIVQGIIYKELLTNLKDICIQFMGYDSIERFDPNGKKLIIPSNTIDYDNFFYNNPRVITTSYKDIYERFYNYLLMDWEIYKVPRFIFNDESNLFEEDLDPLNTFKLDKNEEIKEEIQSIKKLVPPYERNKFFK